MISIIGHVAHTISIGVFLVGIGNKRAVIGNIRHPVTIAIVGGIDRYRLQLQGCGIIFWNDNVSLHHRDRHGRFSVIGIDIDDLYFVNIVTICVHGILKVGWIDEVEIIFYLTCSISCRGINRAALDREQTCISTTNNFLFDFPFSYATVGLWIQVATVVYFCTGGLVAQIEYSDRKIRDRTCVGNIHHFQFHFGRRALVFIIGGSNRENVSIFFFKIDSIHQKEGITHQLKKCAVFTLKDIKGDGSGVIELFCIGIFHQNFSEVGTNCGLGCIATHFGLFKRLTFDHRRDESTAIFIYLCPCWGFWTFVVAVKHSVFIVITIDLCKGTTKFVYLVARGSPLASVQCIGDTIVVIVALSIGTSIFINFLKRCRVWTNVGFIGNTIVVGIVGNFLCRTTVEIHRSVRWCIGTIIFTVLNAIQVGIVLFLFNRASIRIYSYTGWGIGTEI